MIVYTVKYGGKLYLETNVFTMSQRTTTNILAAKLFPDAITAERIARKTGGQVVPIRIEEDNGDNETDMLRASIVQLQKERDAALNELNIYKLNNKEEIK